MGIAWRGQRYLRIEEALYLVEKGVAIVISEGERLTLAHLYNLLEECGISRLKYSGYTEMVGRRLK
jgi:hypothetical protein